MIELINWRATLFFVLLQHEHQPSPICANQRSAQDNDTVTQEGHKRASHHIAIKKLYWKWLLLFVVVLSLWNCMNFLVDVLWCFGMFWRETEWGKRMDGWPPHACRRRWSRWVLLGLSYLVIAKQKQVGALMRWKTINMSQKPAPGLCFPDFAYTEESQVKAAEPAKRMKVEAADPNAPWLSWTLCSQFPTCQMQHPTKKN